MIGLPERPGHLGRDRGSASLEYIGAVVVAGFMVGAVLLGAVAANPDSNVSRAVCKLVTLGQGDCGDVPTNAERVPTQPCVVNGNGSTNTVRGGYVWIGQGSERWMIEELGDGRFRLTRATGVAGGFTEGAGFDLTATYNDNDFGVSLGADINELITAEQGEIYYVSSADEAKRFLSERRWDSGLDVSVGDSGWVRGLVDKVRGQDPLPEPDETWVAGGVLADGKATVDWLAAGAQVDGEMQALLGARLRKDGTQTGYFQGSFSGQATAAMWASDAETNATTLYKTQAGGTVKGLIEVDYDAAGTATAIRLRTTFGGQAAWGKREAGADDLSGPAANAYVDMTVEIPLDSDADREHAAAILSTLGIPYLPGVSSGVRFPIANPLKTVNDIGDFMVDVKDHSRMWEDSYTLNQNTDLGFSMDAELISGLLVEGSTSSTVRTSTGQKYFDGTGWQEREGCAETAAP